MSRNKLINWGIFIVLSFIWGSSFILMKISKDGLSAVQIAAVRIFSAGIIFVPFALFHLSKIPKNKLLIIILSGVFGNLLPAFLFAEAISRNMDSALAGILNSLTPLCVVVIGVSFFKLKVNSRQVLGIVIGFLGLSLLSLSKGGIRFDNLGYAGLILLATIFYGLNVNLVSLYLNKENPFYIATVSLAFMTIPTAIVLYKSNILSIPIADPVVLHAVITSIILGVMGSAIATALFYVLVKRAGGIFASLVTYGIPFIALFWGFVYAEKISLIQIACLGIILIGVYLANRKIKEQG